jgi:FkbH-like protein
MRDERRGRWRQLFRLGASAARAPQTRASPTDAVADRPAWDILLGSVSPPVEDRDAGPVPDPPRQSSGELRDATPAASVATEDTAPSRGSAAGEDLPATPPEDAAPDPLRSPGDDDATPAAPGPHIEFDERWYVLQNQDVALAIAEGRCASGLSHYLEHGRYEGRKPVPGTAISRSSDAPVHRGAAAADVDPAEQSLDHLAPRHSGSKYLTPSDLRVSPCPIRRAMVIGSCFVQALRFGGEWEVDFHLTNNMSRLPDAPPQDFASYDFQVIQIALRSVLPDAALWHLPYADLGQHTALFESVRSRLALQLQSLLAWNRNFGIPAFVMNFLVPQANPMGRLLPRYDLRNPGYFIEQLNQELARALAHYDQVYLLDVDGVAASLGRRYVQDDSVGHLSHNSVLPTPGLIEDRIEPMMPMTHHYETARPGVFAESVREEVVAMYRTLRQADPVKLVVVDLDDTLWNGVSGELDAVDAQMIEGWPIGVAEALAYLKKRGILLAILSKNDDDRIRTQWDQIFRKRLRLEDFATRRIDWNPKPQNMQRILADLNVLPRNVVFVDDNPVERASMKRAFPNMRVLGRYPYYLRRILLWAPETQVAAVTDESARRTEMVQAQIEREALRESVTREGFLQSLGVGTKLYRVGTEHPKYLRALELLNKTNQFNTTGKRWSPGELRAALGSGSELVAFEVADKFVSYGLVGVLLVAGSRIEQFVMSCRVVGLDVEIAVLAAVVAQMRSTFAQPVRAAMVETDANLLCRDLFASCGFQQVPDGWTLGNDAVLPLPGHVEVDAQGLSQAAGLATVS